MSKRLAFKPLDPLNTYANGLFGIIETPDNKMVCSITPEGGSPVAGSLIDQTDANWALGKFNFVAPVGANGRVVFNQDIPDSTPAGIYYLRVYTPQGAETSDTADFIIGGYAFRWDGTTVTYETALPGSSGLSGSNSVTLTFHDANGNPVPNVIFSIVGIGSSQANSSGVATFGLPNGSYTVTAVPTNGIFFSNTTLTVSGTTPLTITGSAPYAPPTPGSNQVTAVGVTRDGHGAPKPNVTVSFSADSPAAGSGIMPDDAFTATSDSAGNLSVALLQSSAYRIKTANGDWVDFVTGATTPYNLPDVLGGY